MKIFNIGDYRYFSSIYVETGSCTGESIKRALNGGFEHIKSVEAYESFYEGCVKRFSGNPLIQLYLGKSYEKLPEMLKEISQPAVIFLDAHPAGSSTFGHDELMTGDQDYAQHNIITRELAVILQHRIDHLIILDDICGTNAEADIYMSMMKSYNPNYKFEFVNEQMGELFTEQKLLVAIP